MWKILKEMGVPDHLTCLLKPYAGQEATVRTGHGTTDWFQIGRGVRQGCILLPCLFNLHAEYIIRNPRLDEAKAGIKIVGRNINNLRYADDTTLLAESGEEVSWNLQTTSCPSNNPPQCHGEAHEEERPASQTWDAGQAVSIYTDTTQISGEIWP